MRNVSDKPCSEDENSHFRTNNLKKKNRKFYEVTCKNTESILAFPLQTDCTSTALCYVIRTLHVLQIYIADSVVYRHAVKVSRFTFKCEINPIFRRRSCRHSSLGCATAQ